MHKVYHFIIRICSITFFAFFIYAPHVSFAQETPRFRALLIACERFVTATETTPVGLHNLQMIEKILSQDVRDFEISRQYGITSSNEALEAAIQYSFKDATENDVSLLYICTHGELVSSANEQIGYLLLSDGALEDRVTATQLETMLNTIQGTKILLVDACYSGTLIQKGRSPAEHLSSFTRTFQSSDYKVLVSSGANEPSWYWRNTSLDRAPPGSSYFTTALAIGAGYLGNFAADKNTDGIITLKEMYDYLWVNQASSTVQMLPQDDDFPFIIYDREVSRQNNAGELISFVFPSTVLDVKKPILTFQYTARSSTRVVYQITYLKNGVWDWYHSVVIPDDSEFDGDMDPMGDISPGRKQVTLNLSEILPHDWTYAMIHVITMGDYQNKREPFIYASRVLSAKRNEDPILSMKVQQTWSRNAQRELELFIGHAIPCNLSVQIRNEHGKLVRKLSMIRPTRPQMLNPEGSSFYWNGLDDNGNSVKPGIYEATAFTRIGGEKYEVKRRFKIDE